MVLTENLVSKISADRFLLRQQLMQSLQAWNATASVLRDNKSCPKGKAQQVG